MTFIFFFVLFCIFQLPLKSFCNQVKNYQNKGKWAINTWREKNCDDDKHAWNIVCFCPIGDIHLLPEIPESLDFRAFCKSQSFLSINLFFHV